MLEGKPENAKGVLEPTNERLAHTRLEIAKEQLAMVNSHYEKLDVETNLLYNEYRAEEEKLQQRFPTEYQALKILEEEKNTRWNNYYDKREEVGEDHDEAQVLYNSYGEKRNEYDKAEWELYRLVREKFPEEDAVVDRKRETYLQASEARRTFLNENNNPVYEKYTEAWKKYEELEGARYEDGVNAFLDTVREYQEKRKMQLNTKLSDGLKALGVFTPENMQSGKNVIAKQLLIMDALASQFKKWATRTAVWAFSITALSWATQKGGELKMDTFLGSKMDSVYNNALQNEPVDSTTTIIFHSIAGDKKLPKEWREFLAREDSSEFFIASLREDYLQNGEGEPTGIISDFESKLNYVALLRINERYGKPKAVYGQFPRFHDRASYSSFGNTMHLPSYTGSFKLEDYIAELSHAAQYATDKKKYQDWHNKDYHHTDSVAKAEGVTYDEAQLDMYSNPTTLEYEAHSIIEPKLKKEFEEIKAQIKMELLKK